MNITRKNFLMSGAALVGATAVAAKNEFNVAEFAALRKELRAFYPQDGQGDKNVPQDARAVESYEAIKRDLQAYAAAHPEYDALDMRRECYRAMSKHFVPFVFKESPFYFEAGVNGGWAGKRPGRLVNSFCSKFYKTQNLIPEDAFKLLNARNRNVLALSCGPFVDDMHHVPPFRTILHKGFGGVYAEVASALAKCPADDPLGRKELETALVGLETVHAIQLKFAAAAEAMLAKGDLDAVQTKRLMRIATAAKRCPWEAPTTFFEGLNTLWFVREILGYIDGTNQFSLGRPDAYLIDLYNNDITAGRLTKEEAREMVAAFLITADCHYNSHKTLDSYNDHELEIPMSLGGCDAAGAPVCNELTYMFLDAHLGCDCVFPKLHCRIGSNMPQAYMEKLGTLLMSGHAVFTLLNDDRFVKQYIDDGYSLEDARAYIGCGCWNGFIDSVQDVDEANYLSLLKVLELTIHRDAKIEKECRLTLHSIDDAQSFAEVREILFGNVMRFMRDVCNEYTRWGRVNAKVFPHPVYSMCLRDGVKSRRDTMDGGIPARPKIITLGFIGNVVDSLMAIKSLCFDKKVCTLKELLAAVRSNWSGVRGEELRVAAMNAPYWGDGTIDTTGELAWWMRNIYNGIDGLRSDQDCPYKLAIYTYREFMYWGFKTKATPDGRRNGERLAQGFSPSEYKCKVGATTLINAAGELPHKCLYASNMNLTFERDAMSPAIWAAVLRVFAKKGMHMIQPNCNSVEQLLEAQQHPERYQWLIVRVCGFSARFVSLSKRWQDEVISRHRLR